MYVFCCSYAHNVAAANKWVAFVSTTVETSNPEAELAPGLALLGHVDEKFVAVSDVHEPLSDGSRCALAALFVRWDSVVCVWGGVGVGCSAGVRLVCICVCYGVMCVVASGRSTHIYTPPKPRKQHVQPPSKQSSNRHSKPRTS